MALSPEEVLRRFDRFIRPRPVAIAPEPPPPDPEALLKAALVDWLSRKPVAFDTWLDDEIAQAHAAADAGAGTPQGAWWLGRESGLRRVRDLFEKMRGQAEGTPPPSPRVR